MKQKLKVAFILIAFALLGIIIFQICWSVSMYRVNKQHFDANIDLAMQRAMDDCKKDYFDSVRRVLIRRLSPAETVIKIDTLHQKDQTTVQLAVHLSNKYTHLDQPFNITMQQFDFYRKKINHAATVADVLTEASFNEPVLMNDFTLLLGMYDIQNHQAKLVDFVKNHPAAQLQTLIDFNHSIPNSIYEVPANYRSIGVRKLHKHLENELYHLGVNSPFVLLSSTQSLPHYRSNMHYTETPVYAYKYQGFTPFGITGPVFYTRAAFGKPQYAIIRGMLFWLLLSLLLMMFIIFCFYYIIRTILAQNKLADLKDDFINNMTHELKTPIATITVAIEGLQKFNVLDDPEKTQRYLQTSRNELGRLNELVTKVLDIAALENREIELVKENINIDDLINDVLHSEKEKTGKTLNINYENKSNAVVVLADKIHLRNLVANLVDNAIKYSPEPVYIDVKCFENANDLVISVKDNGNGIPADQLGLIFDKFHRVPTGNRHTVKGTGLGLSYVKYIVEAHGGSITVKSEINKGSEFIVSIPLNHG